MTRPGRCSTCRLIRAEPERVRATLTRRGAAARLDALLALDADGPGRAHPRRVAPRRAHAGEQGRSGEARRAGARQLGRRGRGPDARARRWRAQEASCASSRPARDAELVALPNLAEEPRRPTAGRTTRSSCAGWATRPRSRSPCATTWTSASAAGVLDLERAARVSGARFAYLLGPLVRLQLALVAFAVDLLEARGLHAGRAPGAGARGGDVRDGLLPHRPGVHLPDGRRRPVPGRHVRGAAGRAARRRDPGRRRPAAALRGDLDLLPARGRRRRQGHARHLPRAPVRQGRDVLVLRARGLRRRASADPGLAGGDPAALEVPYRVVDIAGRRPRARRPRASSTARPGCPGRARYRELTSCSNCTDYQARRLRARVRLGSRPPSRCTRSTARPWPWGAR